MKALRILSVIILLSLGFSAYSQRGEGRRRARHRQAAAVHHSAYRPAKVVVYHPHWRPAYDYHRRWVFFPGYNLYWDNWRNNYVFWNGSIWLAQSAPPPVVVNVNLANEKSVELNENEDDVDDIYQSNNTHKIQYNTP